MDSGLVLRTPRNDDGELVYDAPQITLRFARLRISALTPKVHGSHSSLGRIRLTSLPSCGADMVTMSSRLCVNPCPAASRSFTGANMVPRNSAKPSGY